MISILIPCHNGERWVRGAIESALEQTWSEKEVIVVDDGSTDGSLEIIHSFGDRIHLETGPQRGAPAARNRLLDLASGEWVQYLDADDWLMPGKIAGQAAIAAVAHDIDVLIGPITIEHWRPEGARLENCPIPEPHDPFLLLARWWLPQTGGPLFRRQSLREVGGWKENQPCCQEHELYLRLLMAGKKMRFVEAGGAVYRIWSEDTLCRRNQALTRRERRRITDRLEAYLKRTAQLTPRRRQALNQARFEMARIAWLTDRDEAGEILSEIRHSQPEFLPAEAAAPAIYRALYRWIGFGGAETVASLKRGVARTVGLHN